LLFLKRRKQNFPPFKIFFENLKKKQKKKKKKNKEDYNQKKIFGGRGRG